VSTGSGAYDARLALPRPAMTKTALITGITGQDGALLAEWLLGRGYAVHGIKRRSSLFNTERVDHLYQDPHVDDASFRLHFGDLSDGASLLRIVQQVQPDEIYNLGAMSHVAVSFEQPEYTANVDGLGTLRLLEAVRTLGLAHRTRFYQASTSELFGACRPGAPVGAHALPPAQPVWRGQAVRALDHRELPRSLGPVRLQRHPVQPREPGARRNLRHPQDHPRAGAHRARPAGHAVPGQPGGAARLGPCARLRARHVADAAAAAPQDFVIATGVQHSVREFVRRAGAMLGLAVEFRGHGADEVGIVAAVQPPGEAQLPRCRPGDVIVRVDPRYFRPAEVDTLLGDATRARQVLGWAPEVGFDDLVREMVEHDRSARRDGLVQRAGLRVASARD
jgi:GDPmannose 4,6-dehydratase